MQELTKRISAYRPWSNRLMFGLALAGMLVVVHLGIQQGRGFDQGCFGFWEDAQASTTFNCAAVVQSEAGAFLGVSNITWGLLFYGVIAALSYAIALVSEDWRAYAQQSRAGLVGLGAVYTAYLVYYQFANLQQLCALCLVSAGIVTALFTLQGLAVLNVNFTSTDAMPAQNTKREFTFLTYFAAVAVLLVGADLVYFANLRPARAAERVSAAMADTVQVADGCYYDPEKQPVESFISLIDFQDPIKGNPDAAVTIVEYFDPNCPHCKAMHPIMQRAMTKYGDEARFVYKPMPLWRYSVSQIEALYAAAQEGKFMPMLEAQYQRQQRGGLSLDQLKDIARQIGMNPDVLAARLNQQTYRQRVLSERKKAVDIGVNSTPTVIINGHFIDSRSRSLRCFGEFIEAAKKNTTQSDS